VKPDQRSFRVALVADEYVNPPPGGPDALAAAAQAGWGVMQLPAAGYPPEIAGRMLAEIAEQAEEFSRHGYDFVLVGGRDGLAEALAAVGLAVPDQVIPANTAELAGVLAARPAPAASSWSWLTGKTRRQARLRPGGAPADPG
jgi:hypothetical protein